MKLLTDIWRLLDRRQRGGLLMMQALSLLMALSTLAGIAAVAPFFAVLGDPAAITRSPTLSWLYRHCGCHDQRGFVVALGLAFLGVVLLSNAVNLLGSLAMNRFAHRVGNRFCIALFDEYLHRGQQFHMAANSSTLFNNVVWEVTRGSTGVLQSFLTLSTNAVTSILIIVSIVVVNPLIALGTVIALGGSYGLIYLLARSRLQRNGLLESELTEQRTRIVTESLGAIKEILLLRAQRFFSVKFAHSLQSISRTAINTHAIAQGPRNILECIVVAGLVAVALLLIDDGGRGGLWLAQLSFLGFAAFRLLPALQQIFQSAVKIRGDRVAFERIAADLRSACSDTARSQSDRSEPRSRSGPTRPRDIQLRAVGFRYMGDRPFAIRDATARIPAGATVGLLGASGSGKTTLAELLVGLLVPTSGTVEVDDVVLDEAGRAAWQTQIAYVPQHVFLFDASLAENIALATAPAEIDSERVAAAARLAQLDQFARTLPAGYGEKVGERGVRLSGGQRQRVGIARALYRPASVLVLDEATNALDGLTENEIMTTLQGLRGQYTIVLIAHRVSTPHAFDLVFELDNGTVTERRTGPLRQSTGLRSYV